MFNFGGNLEGLLKLPLKIIVALCFGSGLILFLPNKIIEKMYMMSFRNNLGFIIGIVFIVSLSIVVCSIIVFIFSIDLYLERNSNYGKIRFRHCNRIGGYLL